MGFARFLQRNPLDLSGIQTFDPNLDLLDQALKSNQDAYDAGRLATSTVPDHIAKDQEAVQKYMSELEDKMHEVEMSYINDVQKGGAAMRNLQMDLTRDYSPGGKAYMFAETKRKDDQFKAALREMNLPPDYAELYYNNNRPQGTFDAEGNPLNYEAPLGIPPVPDVATIGLNAAKEVLSTKTSHDIPIYNKAGDMIGTETVATDKLTKKEIAYVLDKVMKSKPEIVSALKHYGEGFQKMIDEAILGASEAFNKNDTVNTAKVKTVKPGGKTKSIDVKESNSSPTTVYPVGTETSNLQEDGKKVWHKAFQIYKKKKPTDKYLDYTDSNLGSKVYENNERLVEETKDVKKDLREVAGDSPFSQNVVELYSRNTTLPADTDELETLPKLSDLFLEGTTEYEILLNDFTQFEAERLSVPPESLDELEMADAMNRQINKLDKVIEARNTYVSDKLLWDKRSEEEFTKLLSPLEQQAYKNIDNLSNSELFELADKYKYVSKWFDKSSEEVKAKLNKKENQILTLEEEINNLQEQYNSFSTAEKIGSKVKFELDEKKRQVRVLKKQIPNIKKRLDESKSSPETVKKVKDFVLDNIKNKTDRKDINNKIVKELYPQNMDYQVVSFLPKNSDGSSFVGLPKTISVDKLSPLGIIQMNGMQSLKPRELGSGKDKKLTESPEFKLYGFKSMSGIDDPQGVEMPEEKLKDYVGFESTGIVTDANGNFHLHGKFIKADGTLSDGYYAASSPSFNKQLRNKLKTARPLDIIPQVNADIDALEIGSKVFTENKSLLGSGYSYRINKDLEGNYKVILKDFDGTEVRGGIATNLKDSYDVAKTIATFLNNSPGVIFDKELKWDNMVNYYNLNNRNLFNNLDFETAEKEGRSIEKKALDKDFAPKVNSIFEGFEAPVIVTSALRSLNNQKQYKQGPQYNSKHLVGKGLDVRLTDQLAMEIKEKWGVDAVEGAKFTINGLDILIHNVGEGLHLDIKDK
jgi:hypothetical protein